MPLSTILLCAMVVVFSTTSPSFAQETDQDMPVGAVGGSVHADLFTGTATTSTSSLISSPLRGED